ncbi:MAG: hypothetical protein MAGBODY4_00946 [Candidatus Marinimicrobia bacterium]|nr:hypothetical protein [Candidatus Neomarinimicrobiota bacterium]
MQTYIALFRGINVGGRHRIKMTDLRSLQTGIPNRPITWRSHHRTELANRPENPGDGGEGKLNDLR